jgi:hypothetical protein
VRLRRPHITGEYLAGFVDGEGCLSIAGRGGSLQPRFRINQRDDDGQLVRAIRAFLGAGSLYEKRDRKNPRAMPQLALTLAGADCMRLVEVLDYAPLRSKKRHEYPIWREAVVVYGATLHTRWTPATQKSERARRLAALRDDLREARRYKGAR